MTHFKCHFLAEDSQLHEANEMTMAMCERAAIGQEA